MRKLEKYRDILFSTLAEITSLIIAGNDKPLIFQRLLDCCLTVLEAERVYLLELQPDRIIRYSKSKLSQPDQGIKIEELAESPTLREWMMRESRESGGFRKGEELAFDLPSLASQCLELWEELAPATFVGHSHLYRAFALTPDAVEQLDGERLVLDEERKHIINIRSAGQPRDDDASTCFALFDAEARELTLRRRSIGPGRWWRSERTSVATTRSTRWWDGCFSMAGSQPVTWRWW